MRVQVKVKPQAREDRIEKTGENRYAVWVKAKPVEGRANQAVVKVLSKHFDIAKSRITLLKGEKSRDKVFEVYQG